MPSLSPRDEKSLRLIVAKLDMSGGPLACHPYIGCRRGNGYGLIGRCTNSVPIVLSAHREIYRLVVRDGAPIPDDLDVLHECDNPPCCNVLHLHLGTPVENAEERVARGRDGSRHGEQHHNAKLTDDAARTIYLLRGLEKQRVIAARYGVSQRVIGFIQRGEGYERATRELRLLG